MTIAQRFAELGGRKALLAFFTAGDQPLSEMPAIISALEEGGVDVIEVGVPFSDPYGEGPTIQASSFRALRNGVTQRAILDGLACVEARVPLVTMGYYNPILRFGVGEYARALAAAGVTGGIIQDLVPDEADEWCDVADANGLETIFLAAPTSTPERVREVCRRSTGFVYAISRTGVTGAADAVPPEAAELVRRLKLQTTRPVCVGFGISRPEHVRLVWEFADGAIVGSSLVDLMHRVWSGGQGRQEVVDYLRKLKQGGANA